MSGIVWLSRLRRRQIGAAGPLSEPPWRDGFGDSSYYEAGRGTYGQPIVNVFRGDRQKVRVGSWCSIGPRVSIFVGGNHPIGRVSTYPFLEKLELPGAYVTGTPSSRGDVEVGSDVWIGEEAVILSGVTIGHGAVIGARAVVARDVRPYAIVIGNPAHEVRRRFDDDTVELLLRARWWDWPLDRIRDSVGLLTGTDVRWLADIDGRTHT